LERLTCHYTWAKCGRLLARFARQTQGSTPVCHITRTSHGERAQAKYTSQYNLRNRDKHFSVGEQMLILVPDSTASKVYSRWKGPATVVEVKSPYRYLVELNGSRQHVHANKLRKFHVRVDEVMCNDPGEW